MSTQGEDSAVEHGQGMVSNQDSGSEEEVDVQQQISELAKKQQEVMTAISSLNTVPTRSYVYVPRERHIAPFSGDIDKDGKSVDEFIEEVERVLSARNQSAYEQFDFVMSLLRGSALEEVRLRKDDTDQISDLFCYLREAFGDKRSASQLLQNFYSCRQKEGEDIRDFSHALSQVLNSVLKHHPHSVANEKEALRDQFVEGVGDPSLRRELRKYVRAHPKSSLIDVREEAYLWVSEEPAVSAKSVKSKVKACSHMTTDAQCTAVTAEKQVYLEDVMKVLTEQGKVSTTGKPSEKSVSLHDLMIVLAEQGKVITELTKAVKNLTTQNQSPSTTAASKPKTLPKFTADGKPICFRCQTEGHVAKQCPQKRHRDAESSPVSGQQGNGNPWLH